MNRERPALRSARQLNLMTVTVIVPGIATAILAGWARPLRRFTDGNSLPHGFWLLTALASLVIATALPFCIRRAGAILNQARSSRQNELRFLAASEGGHDAFYVLESVRDADDEICDFRIVYVNTNGAQLVSSTAERLQGRLLREQDPLHRTDGFFARCKRVVRTGERLEEEFPIPSPAVNASWLRFQVLRLKDGVAITATDISSQKEQEAKLVSISERLRQSEARLVEVQQLARLGNLELDLDSMTMTWSEEVYRIFDRDPEQGPLSIPELLEHIHSDDLDRMEGLAKLIMESDETQDLDYRVIGKAGDTRYVHSRARRHLDRHGQTVQLSGTLIDVTEKIRLHDALTASNKRFEAFMENSPTLAFIKDRQGRVLYMNHMCQKLWQSEGKDWSAGPDAEPWPQQWANEFRQADLQVLNAGEPCTEVTELPIPGGGISTLLTYKFPLNLPGQDRLLGGIAIDISEQQEAEKRSRQALADKELLLKEVHHRVKNNLQVICSLLGMQAANVEDPGTIAALHDSRDRVQSMAMIHEMLYGSGTLRDIDFRAYTERLLLELLTSYGIPTTRVRPDIRISPIRFDLDRAIPCGLILNELISNALKYAFPAQREGSIIVSLSTAGEGYCRMTVEDNGIGLPHGFCIRNTTSLGLRIVNILVGQLKGELHFDSTAGSRFQITFPI